MVKCEDFEREMVGDCNDLTGWEFLGGAREILSVNRYEEGPILGSTCVICRQGIVCALVAGTAQSAAVGDYRR